MDPHYKKQRINVLLYITHHPLASRLTELLTSHDMAVTTAYTLSDLQDAMKLGGLGVATTDTAGIEMVRQASSLPVVNIEAFVFSQAGPSDDTSPVKRFDSSAFVKRVDDVAHAGISETMTAWAITKSTVKTRRAVGLRQFLSKN